MLQDVIRANFERIRAEKGVKIEDLAAALGVRRQQVHKYSYGGTVASLEKLAAALEVEPWQLLKPAQDPAAPDAADRPSSARLTCPHCGRAVTVTLQD